MYVSHTTVDTTGQPLAIGAAVAEEMERWLRELDGFEGLVLLGGEGRAVGLAFWESREVAERHAAVRTQFRERMLAIAGVRIEEVVDYEVVFARFGAALTSAAGSE